MLYSKLALGQEQKAPQATIVVGDILSTEDSIRVRRLFFDGLHEKIIGNTAAASDRFTSVINIDRGNDAAIYELALISHTENKHEDVENLIRMAVTINPDNHWYWILLRDVYSQTGNLFSLELVYDELIRLNPDIQEYYLAKAFILADENKLNEANVLYEIIRKKFGSSAELIQLHIQIYLQQGHSKKAIAILEKQIRQNPKNSNNYLHLAKIYKQLNNQAKAIALLEKGGRQNPASTFIRLTLGEYYYTANRLDDAFIEFKIAFADNLLSINEKLRVLLSFFPLVPSSPSEKLQELTSIAIQAHPDNPTPYAVYGDIFFQKKKYTAALEAYKMVIQCNSNESSDHFDQLDGLWEQVLRIELDQSNFQQTILDGDQALAISSNPINLYLLMAIDCERDQQHEKAITYLEKALHLEPKNPQILEEIYAILGSSYHILKKYNASDEAYEKALRINPNNSYTLNSYAYYLWLRGITLEKAAKMSTKSIQLTPNNASLEDHLCLDFI